MHASLAALLAFLVNAHNLKKPKLEDRSLCIPEITADDYTEGIWVGVTNS